MTTFIYWQNKKDWHELKLLEVEAEGILEADKKFEDMTGINPLKASWVSCQIFPKPGYVMPDDIRYAAEVSWERNQSEYRYLGRNVHE